MFSDLPLILNYNFRIALNQTGKKSRKYRTPIVNFNRSSSYNFNSIHFFSKTLSIFLYEVGSRGFRYSNYRILRSLGEEVGWDKIDQIILSKPKNLTQQLCRENNRMSLFFPPEWAQDTRISIAKYGSTLYLRCIWKFYEQDVYFWSAIIMVLAIRCISNEYDIHCWGIKLILYTQFIFL